MVGKRDSAQLASTQPTRQRAPESLQSAVMDLDDLQLGQRIRVLQTIDRRERDWTTAVEGVVRDVNVQPSVSWYTHGKAGRVWSRRVLLEKPDGEQTLVNVDQYTRFELVAPVTAAAE
jgi:hypothetical protein